MAADASLQPAASRRPGPADPPVDTDGNRLCVLAVHAHPDDEASKGAPTVAMYHEQGVASVLVCCTGGEEGELQNPALREDGQPFHGLSPAEEQHLMAHLRPQELARSAQIIGFDDVVMLDYRDSGMLGTMSNHHRDSFAMAQLDDAVGRLVTIVRRTKPQVILTYSDDQRGYPHPDHLKVHDISVLAFQRAGDPMWYPWAGPVWQPLKLYYTVWSRSRLMAIHEAMQRLRGSSPYDETWLNRPSQDERITTRLDVGKYLWARSQALMAHASQVDPTEAWWFGLSDDELAEVYPWEDWVLARSAVDGPAEGVLEHDLFAGVRAEPIDGPDDADAKEAE
jgi:mycothiol S-conjugate amidase